MKTALWQTKNRGNLMAQVALNWVANRPGVASVIVGATKLSQLEDNCKRPVNSSMN